VHIEKSGDSFRLMYDIKGRFVLHAVGAAEAGFKLCRITKASTSPKGIPFVVTHDGRTIRYPDPAVKTGDSAKVDLESGKITDFVKFEVGNTVMVTKGRNTGRVGTMIQRDAHPGSFDIVHVRDAEGNAFATRIANVFVIGKGGDAKDALVSLPRGKGIKRTIFEVRAACGLRPCARRWRCWRQGARAAWLDYGRGHCHHPPRSRAPERLASGWRTPPHVGLDCRAVCHALQRRPCVPARRSTLPACPARPRLSPPAPQERDRKVKQ